MENKVKFKNIHEERDSIFPDSKIKEQLDAKFQQKHFKRNALIVWLNRPVPAWQMAASVLILFISGGLWFFSTPEEKNKVSRALADTVFIEKWHAAKIDTIYLKYNQNSQVYHVKEQKVYSQSLEVNDRQDTMKATKCASQSIELYQNKGIHIMDFKNHKSAGNSMKEDSIGQQWLANVL